MPIDPHYKPQTRCSVRSPPILDSTRVKPLESPRTIFTPALVLFLRAPPPAGHAREGHDESKRPTSRTITPDATSSMGLASPYGPASTSPALSSETTACQRPAQFEGVRARREARTTSGFELEPGGTAKAVVALETYRDSLRRPKL